MTDIGPVQPDDRPDARPEAQPDDQAGEQLVTAARAGDRPAFEELVRITYRSTYTLALRLTANEEDARDVCQDSYLRAWRGIGRFRGDAQFSTWMYRITANTASTHLGRRHRTRTEPLDDVAEPEELQSEILPAEAAESSAGLARLSDALDELPTKLRAVVVLRDVYDLPHDEIAAQLGISVTAAKVRLHRARKRLRDDLDADPARADHAV